ncbi:hypothetical protein [Janthinobacterium sp. SUN033]|uniref:hypothetical protein n=1 Tax=Janthinobacterium sp. SUN033 TaxID=3002439 RepID=UPI0025B03A7E|nr:hypothetical protein [Janthinobacterium sp. SUN033]MDN2676697.1 hypothetical protein [Janthinobacterium sp. SUN033]
MTGDQSDIVARIKSVLPPWFGPVPDLIDALVHGLANVSAFTYSLFQYAVLQTRIKTATDGWLDMIAADFFGNALIRAANQSDASFRARIIINLFRERATRNAITRVLTDLTGRAPIIIEPQRPADTGAYSAPNSGYGVAGAYGSMLLPFQAFVQAYRPASSGIPYIAGYGSPPGGYSAPSRASYATMSQSTGAVTDADLYAAVDSVKPVGTIVWMNIRS